MKKLILISFLAVLSTSAMAARPTNTSKVCIFNHTSNLGKTTGAHDLAVQLSWPGVPDNFEGPWVNYGQESCWNTGPLADKKVYHIFSAGHGFFGPIYTDCGAMYHDKSSVLPQTAVYEAIEVKSGQMEYTKCNFLYNTPN